MNQGHGKHRSWGWIGSGKADKVQRCTEGGDDQDEKALTLVQISVPTSDQP